jgi:general secretion pathway protein K
MKIWQMERHNKSGYALIITLLIVALLTSLTVEFAHEVYINTNALSNWTNAQKASLTAKSGQVLASKYIKSIANLSYTYPGRTTLPIEKKFGDDTLLIIKIEDEDSKFNINSIIYQNGLTNTEALSSLKRLLEYLDINPSLALAIADWIDPDSEPRLRDSEYMAKNSYLWSIDELRLIPGIDRKVYEKIKPFITVFRQDRRININTAELPVLISLHPDITETLAQKIIDYRESSPFEKTYHILRVSGMESIGPLLIGKLISVKSTNFRVISMATVSEITRVIESVMDTSMNIKYWREG